MLYRNVCLEALSYTLPDDVVKSAELERRLAPLYRRLRLPEGRLEMITGIRERRFWPPRTLPSQFSVRTAERALTLAGLDRSHVGALVHASVCRDFVEPATACAVHHGLDLPMACQIYDLSNACLGIANGMIQVANMIELGQIRAGIIVGTESGRHLVERTVETLNADESLTRESIKSAIASLTIGSGSAAVLLVNRELSRTGNRLLGGVVLAQTTFHDLCHSGLDPSMGGELRPLMETDAERLMLEGVELGKATFEAFLSEVGWTRDDVHKTFCHQIGSAHRKLMLGSLGLDLAKDFPTYETLGNTGSVALPITMAIGIEQGHLKPNEHAALLGIGSGINSIMLAVEWKRGLRA